MKNKCKTTNLNPCDFFMRELSINYPKKQADEDTIKYYSEKYHNEQADRVREELKSITFGELDIKRARGQAIPFRR